MIKNAKWIKSPTEAHEAVHTFKKRIALQKNKKIKRATLYVSAMGVYVPYIDGTRVTSSVLMPGFTSYKFRIQYQAYDVTDMLRCDSELSIGVGSGWAVGNFGYGKDRYFFADHTSLIASLDLIYSDGTIECVLTDGTWEVYTSEVTYSDIYHGETVDKTASPVKLGYALVDESVKSRLIRQVGEDICEDERLAPVSLIITPRGERVIDFGQNMTGYVEIKIKAPRGERIVLHHAEVLDKDGNFYTENYRKARNENVYVASGDTDVFKPCYTFQGFRYVRLTEYPLDNIDLTAFTAIAVNSKMKRTGRFRCGNEKINQLYHNVIWGQKSNYLDIPTDCPQRDERLGWTGDAQVFCRTAAINFDVEKFFEKWLGDLAIEQKALGGAVEGVIPRVCKEGNLISAAWGDVACIAPFELYLAYGNKGLLKKHFPIMRAWVDFLITAGPEKYLWLGYDHYGDWLGMDAGEDSYVGATSTDLIASAYFAYSTSLLIKAADALGINADYYRELYKNIRASFRDYFMEDGMPKELLPPPTVGARSKAVCCHGMTQTAIVLILHFGLAEEYERPALAKKLSELIEKNGGLMSTGFVGTPYILHALADNGYTDLAYSLLFEERSPSWLYSVNRGATTMWEHWNGIKEDGSFWSADMNSFNHYAYGSVFDWIFGVSSGIKPRLDGAGYEKIDITPKPSPLLGFADAEIDTRRGKLRSYWYYKGEQVIYELVIPKGATAYLTLPSGRSEILGEGAYIFTEQQI